MPNVLMLSTGRPSAHDAAGGSAVQAAAITTIGAADLDDVGAAYHATWLGTREEMTLDDAVADVRAAWNGEYGSWNASLSFAARIGGRVVGAILTVDDAPWDDVPGGPFIIDLFVIPGQRRQGIGRALAIQALQGTDARVGLRVDVTATAARALYASLGFVEA